MTTRKWDVDEAVCGCAIGLEQLDQETAADYDISSCNAMRRIASNLPPDVVFGQSLLVAISNLDRTIWKIQVSRQGAIDDVTGDLSLMERT